MSDRSLYGNSTKGLQRKVTLYVAVFRMWGCWRSLLSCQPDFAAQQVGCTLTVDLLFLMTGNAKSCNYSWCSIMLRNIKTRTFLFFSNGVQARDTFCCHQKTMFLYEVVANLFWLSNGKIINQIVIQQTKNFDLDIYSGFMLMLNMYRSIFWIRVSDISIAFKTLTR